MGGKTTTSTNQVTIPQDVLDRYNAVNAQAAKVAENPFQKYGTTQEDFVAQFNEQQLKGVQGINDVAAMGPVYENIDKYLNPYTKNVADTTRAQMEQAQEQAQSGALGTAVQSGAFGGDRAGVAAANLANQNQMAMGSTMANIYNQGYTQAIDTSMNDRNRMLGVAGAQLGAGTQMQQTEQAGLDALINQFQQEQGYPFQVAQFLANIAMGTGALSGSTTTTTQPAQIFSDRRLKHDIKKIGEADNGLPIYTFKYKGDEHHQTHVGFMADEVEKKNPDAVGLDPSGYKTVDYDKAAQSMGGGVHAHNKGEAFADGGVAGPYGSKVGQGVGVGSYVPQAYLPVGELMMADPAVATQHETGIADALESAAAMGKSVAEIRDLLNKNARGGVVGYADGGGVEPKLHGDYLSSTLAAQEAGKDKPELMTARPAEKQESALGNIASTLGSIATIAKIIPFSDRRLKHDIKRIGKTEKGLPIYTFKYKGDDREQTHVGFMADEVERDHPEAVGKRDGYKTVDYSQAHKFADGGVAGRHGYALDGSVEERLRDAMRLTRDEVPAAQTLGSLPDARVVAAEAPRTPAPKEYAVGDDVFTRSNGLIADARGNPVPIELASSVRGEIERQDRDYGNSLLAQSDEMKGQFEQVLADKAERNRNALTGMYGGVFPVSENAKAAQAGLAQAAMPALGTEDESVRAYRMAAANRFNAEPTGVVPSSDQMRPKPRPENLGATAAPAVTGGLGAANVSTPVIVGTTMTPAEKGSPFDLDRLAAATRLQESGSPSGNYGAIGKPVKRGDGFDYAYGAYGIMGANIPSWTEEVLGKPMTPDEFLRDPAAQDKVAKAKLAEYHAKYGNIEDVASMWFSGRPFENNTSVDATSGKSVPSYVSDMVSNYYGGGVGPAANYDIASMPSGVAGNDRLSMSARDNRQEGGVKPYEDRNALGKMMYDEDGRVNKNAMLSLFAGLGDMLSSPSPFLLPAIGAGISGAAKTYMAREEQVADIAKTNVENLNKLYDLYNSFIAQNEEYAGMTLEEFAKKNNLGHLLPKGSQLPTGTDVSPTSNDKMTVQEYRSGFVDMGGRKVAMSNDPASIQKFINDNAGFSPETYIGRQVEEARAQLLRLDQSGFTIDAETGEPFAMPGPISASDELARAEANRIASEKFRDQAPEAITASNRQTLLSNELAKVFVRAESGTLAEPSAQLQGLLKALDPQNTFGWTDNFEVGKEDYDSAAKLAGEIIASRLQSLPGGAPASTIDLVSTVVPNLGIQPEAAKKLIAMQLAEARYTAELYSGYDSRPDVHGTDINAYGKQFAAGDRFKKYYEEALESLPLFAGEVPQGIDPTVWSLMSKTEKKEAQNSYNLERGGLNGN
jgi:hypothetical protein